MLHIADKAAFQNSLADLPVVTYQSGETVIVDGSKTDRLLILKKGNVAIVKEDTEIARWRSLAPRLFKPAAAGDQQCTSRRSLSPQPDQLRCGFRSAFEPVRALLVRFFEPVAARRSIMIAAGLACVEPGGILQ